MIKIIILLLTPQEKHGNIKSVTITDFVTRKKNQKEAYKLFIRKGEKFYGKVCL